METVQFNFEWFDRNAPVQGEYAVTFLRTGIINLSQALYDEKLSSYEYIRLGFDKKNQVVALKPVQSEEAGACKLSTIKNGKQPRISGHTFLKVHNLEDMKASRYEAEWDEENCMVLVRLDEEVER